MFFGRLGNFIALYFLLYRWVRNPGAVYKRKIRALSRLRCGLSPIPRRSCNDLLRHSTVLTRLYHRVHLRRARTRYLQARGGQLLQYGDLDDLRRGTCLRIPSYHRTAHLDRGAFSRETEKQPAHGICHSHGFGSTDYAWWRSGKPLYSHDPSLRTVRTFHSLGHLY